MDLGQVHPLSQVRVWNRADNDDVAARAANFSVLLSNDGKEWREVYRHNGRVFYGYRMPDRSPLVVKLTNAEARFVRIQLPGTTFLHLDEVEVIGQQGGNLALHKPADQSSLSQWSAAHGRNDRAVDWAAEARKVLANCERMLSEMRAAGESQSHARPHPRPSPPGEGETFAALGQADRRGVRAASRPKSKQTAKIQRA